MPFMNTAMRSGARSSTSRIYVQERAADTGFGASYAEAGSASGSAGGAGTLFRTAGARPLHVAAENRQTRSLL